MTVILTRGSLAYKIRERLLSDQTENFKNMDRDYLDKICDYFATIAEEEIGVTVDELEYKNKQIEDLNGELEASSHELSEKDLEIERLWTQILAIQKQIDTASTSTDEAWRLIDGLVPEGFVPPNPEEEVQ